MKKKQMICLVLLSCALLLSGCFESSLTFEVRFAQIAGLQQDDPVSFEQNVVGRVGKISYTQQGDYLVELSIEPPFKNAATKDSKFFIAADPADPQGKAVIILQEQPGGAMLPSGAVVQGSDGSWYLEELMSKMRQQAVVVEDEMRRATEELKESLAETSQQLDSGVERTLSEVSAQLKAFGDEMKRVPDSREVKQLEKSIQRFVDKLNKEQREVREQLKKEVIPELQRKLEQLREKLLEDGRDQEAEEIDRQLKEITLV